MSNNNENTIRNYYDILVSNLNSKSLSSNDTLKYEEVRDTANAFVNKASDYLFSIVRFSLETNCLPIWFCEIQSGQSDINLSIYSISMEYNNQIVQTYIEYIPQDKTANIPTPPYYNSNNLQTFCDYYYVYNYQYLIFLLNNTISKCFTDLQNLTTLPTSNIPYFKWNTTNNIATLISDNNGFNDTSSDYIKIYMNNALFNLFESFPSYTINNTSSQGLIYQISTSSYGIADKLTINNITYLSCSQEFSTISIWNPVLSIVFLSFSLPIKSESIGAPLIFINDNKYQSSTNNNIQSVITDFQTGDNIYKSYVNYQPTVLRYIQLNSDQPITKIDISCYWKNRLGELIPFKLNPNNSMTIKVCFTRLFTQT